MRVRRNLMLLIINSRQYCVHLLIAVVIVLLTFIWCEWLVYHAVISQCAWPPTNQHAAKVLKVAFIADTHLLGPRRGHWWDKLRRLTTMRCNITCMFYREWQMRRSFQTLIQWTSPDHVFFLGDLFDEGNWGAESVLNEYARRFRSHFDTSTQTRVHVVFGNHDLGFHYDMSPTRNEWYRRQFSTEHVQLVNIDTNLFVLITSMGLEQDGCRFCVEMMRRLLTVNETLACLMRQSVVADDAHCATLIAAAGLPTTMKYTRPILLQHFPLYRESDAKCARTPDAMPVSSASDRMRPKWDCVGENATHTLMQLIRPKAVFSGHTHYACTTEWPHYASIEHTVASFSWRNTDRPSVLLALVSPEPDVVEVETCLLPVENTVIFTYALSVVLLLITLRVFTSWRKLKYC